MAEGTGSSLISAGGADVLMGAGGADVGVVLGERICSFGRSCLSFAIASLLILSEENCSSWRLLNPRK